MARQAEQLEARLPNTGYGFLQGLALHSTLRFPAVAGEGEIVRYSSYLLDLTSSSDAQHYMQTLEAQLLDGRTERMPSKCGAGTGTGCMNPSADFEFVVVAHDGTLVGDLEASIDDVVGVRDPDTPRFTVVVGPTDAGDAIPGAGYVKCAAANVMGDAALVFKAVSSMGAASLLSCIDADDLEPVVEATGAPCIVISGCWNPASHSLPLASPASQQALEQAQRVAAFVFTPGGASGALSALSAIRSASQAEYFANQIAVNYLKHEDAGDGEVRIILLLAGAAPRHQL